MNEKVMHGVVKFWLRDKGYGFIENPDGSDKDIFVHHSGIIGPSGQRRDLKQDQQVQFEIRKTDKGFAAVNVIGL